MTCNALGEKVGRAGGQMQIERGVRRRDQAQQAGVQGHQLIHRRAHQIRNQPQIHGIVDGHRIGKHRRIERHVVEAILRGMVGDDDGGQNLRHVVLVSPGSSLRL